MSKSSHALKIQKGSTTYTCDLYTTTAEARSNLYPNYPLFRVNVDGTNLYAPFTSTLDSAKESTPLVCPIFAGDGNNTLYCVAQKSCFSVGITTKANETITVTASNYPVTESGTGSYSFTSGTKWFPYGTTWTASASGNTGWTTGTVSPASGTVTNANATVTATAATHKTYTVTMPSTSHQTVKLYYKDYNGSSYATSDYQSTTGNKVLGHGSSYYITVTADTGWTAGTVSNAGSSSSPLTLTAARTVTVTAATHKTFVLTLKATTNQTITTKYKNHNGTELASSWSDPWTSGSSDKTKTLGYGSKYYSTIAASTGYTAGTISSPGTASSPNTLTAAKSISATAATAITPKVTITSASGNKSVEVDIIYTNTSGTSTTASHVTFNAGTSKSYTIKYNTTIKIYTRTGNTRYKFKVGSGSYSGNYSYHETYTSSSITSNTTITFTAVNVSSGGGGGDS